MNENEIKLSKEQTEQIVKCTAYRVENLYQLLCVISDKINYLESHNKNYTKKQYFEIVEIKDIIDAIHEPFDPLEE